MLLDALFRSEPLENPATPITSESAETDNVFARDVFVSPHTAMKLAAVYAEYRSDAAACYAENQ